MALERDLELLDRYIANGLKGEEKAAFEQLLNADPELKREYTLQQNIAEGIRQARRVQLKTMLNNIPVPAPTGGEAVLAKTLAGLLVAGAIGAGVYLYLKPGKDTTAAQQESPATEIQPGSAISSDTAPATETPAVAPTEQHETATAPAPAEQAPATTVTKPARTKDSAAAVPQEPTMAKPNVTVFDPSEEGGNTGAHDDGSLRESSSEPKSSKAEIEVRTDSNNKKYTFHYQFKEGKLYLYGSFEKNLYEIMEFFSDNKRTVFLFYKESYYLLNEESDKIRPLTPINDPVLLKKLTDYRGK
jgi:hypothetical protein